MGVVITWRLVRKSGNMYGLPWIGPCVLALLLEGCVDSIGSRNGRQPGFYKVEAGKCDRDEDNILSPADCKNAVDLQMPASNNRTFQGNRKKRPFGCWAEMCRSP